MTLTTSNALTATSNNFLAELTTPCAAERTPLATSNKILLFPTIVLAPRRMKSSGFLSAAQAVFAATHTGLAIRLQQLSHPGRLQTHFFHTFLQHFQPLGHPMHAEERKENAKHQYYR